MNTPLNIVILAAGQGKRMYSSLPKVLHPIAGLSMLRRVIDTAKTLNPQKLIVVYGHGGAAVRAAIPDEDLIWAEQSQQLGTGHALKMALPFLDAQGKTLVLYGDVPLTLASTLADFVAAAGSEMGVLTDVLANPTGYGRIKRNAQGQAVAIVEHKDCTAEELLIAEINTGMMVLPNAHLPTWLAALGNQNAQAEYYLTDVLALAVADDVAVNTLQVPNSWEAEGVNNKVQLAALERIYQANVARALLSAGVTLFDAHRLDVRGTLTHGQDVVIDVNCVFEGHVHLGDGVQIGANCVIKNCVLGAGTVVQAFSHLDGATVGENVSIGPFARLRPETVLANQVHVGNFVEIKKSSVGVGSKVNHLTYLGDASVGHHTNIGAGSVTCNYDGVNKFVTTIGDNVFVGSGTLMVAPVTLEDGATIGAGTVLTKKAPAGLLTVGRAPVLSRVWTRPIKK